MCVKVHYQKSLESLTDNQFYVTRYHVLSSAIPNDKYLKNFSTTVNMLRLILLVLLLVTLNVFGEDVSEKIVQLDIGGLRGEKYWQGDFYEFYGVPYATAPKGRDKFKVGIFMLLCFLGNSLRLAAPLFRSNKN